MKSLHPKATQALKANGVYSQKSDTENHSSTHFALFPSQGMRLPCLVSLAASVPCSPALLCLPRATFSCWPCHPCAPMSCASPPGHPAPHTPLILQQHCSCCWLCQLPSPAAPSVIWVLGPSRGEPCHRADYFLLLNNCPLSKIL